MLDTRGREGWFLAALLVAMFAAFQLHLATVIIPDMDEGTYLYAGELFSKGLVPYRDFLLAHPPAIALYGAACFDIFGSSILAPRIVYLALILASTVPLFALVRSVSGLPRAALLSVATYMTGMLLVANMGRTVRLEPLMNAFLIAGIACRLLRPKSLLWMGVMGLLFASAIFVKATAVVPASLFFLADVIWGREEADAATSGRLSGVRGLAMRWGLAAAGAGVILAPGLAWCLSQPHFVRDVLQGQTHRPWLGFPFRMSILAQNVARYPLILVGLVAAVMFLGQARDGRLKTLAFVALGNTLVLLFAFKTFFNYYIVQALPWIASTAAVLIDELGGRFVARRWPAVFAVVLVVLGVAAPLGYAETYERRASAHVSAPKQILALLPKDGGYLYSMYPGFGLWSGRSIFPWYYQADSLVPRLNGWIPETEFIQVFEGSTALVLYAGELDPFPAAREYVSRHFGQRYSDSDWTLWVRSQDTVALPN
jgi:hypothetical protein